MLLFSHPTGNPNVRAALTGLLEAGALQEFNTSLAAYPNNVWDRIGKTQWGREFKRRSFDQRLQALTVQHPTRELARMVASRLKLSPLIRHETGPFCIDSVYRALDRSVAHKIRSSPGRYTGVYAYEDGALASLLVAQEMGLAGIYDLPIGYWRTSRSLLTVEMERWPEWRNTLTGFKDSAEKLDRKDAELAAASKIIVASSFTASTLKNYPNPLPVPKVVPYGFPHVSPNAERVARGPITRARPLRLLFVGGLSQRKGIADLFAAVDRLGDYVSLTVIGRKVTAECPVLDKALTRHQWIPSLPHEGILSEMKAHDVLVFPSLFEGFGLVITEAMSQGTPVITTDRTAGPDLITHGENGWLISAGNTEALMQQLEELIKKPDTITESGNMARKTAAARPWTVYASELVEALSII